MTDSIKPKYDYIIVGGGLSGLLTAHQLDQKGLSCLVLEVSDKLGGGNQSFVNSLNDTFDMGYHAFDLNRSKISNDFFKKIMKEGFYEHALNRGIVLGNHLIPYNSDVKGWPSDLRELCELSDSVFIEGEPTKAVLANSYGAKFVDYIIENTLVSYPSIVRSISMGADIEEHLGYVYPWFFPRLPLKRKESTEWENFHDSMRSSGNQLIAYPKEDGFYGFISCIINSFSENINIVKKFKEKNITLETGATGTCVSRVLHNDSPIEHSGILWCAPLPAFFGLIGKPLKNIGVIQKLIIGNFSLSREAGSDFHEILVGSKNHLINRIGFPGRLQGKTNNLIQVEFYYPADEYSKSEEEWQDSWTQSLINLKLINSKDDVREFNFLSEIRGLVTKEPFVEISEKLSETISDMNTNVQFPFKMVGPENINRIVEGVILSCEKYN